MCNSLTCICFVFYMNKNNVHVQVYFKNQYYAMAEQNTSLITPIEYTDIYHISASHVLPVE